jgi:hypothetical protein
MEKHLVNNSMEICFESDKMALRILWLPDNHSLATVDYIDCWITISRYVDVLKPEYLLFDAYEFEYRTFREVNTIFNDISQKLKPVNIAIVTSNNILGEKSLEDLMKNCPLKGHNVLDNSNEGRIWFESHNPYARLID